MMAIGVFERKSRGYTNTNGLIMQQVSCYNITVTLARSTSLKNLSFIDVQSQKR